MKPLHDLEVLTHLGEDDRPDVRSWAQALLAIRAPERFCHLPTEPFAGLVSVMTAPPALYQAFQEALAQPTTAGQAAKLAMSLWQVGVPVEPLADALRAAFRGDGDPRDMWLGLALGPLGPLQPDQFAAAARAVTANPSTAAGHASWALPLLVLRQAAPEDLPEAARSVARELRRDGSALPKVLAGLGAPPFDHQQLTDPDLAVRLGASFVGVRNTGPPPPGGRKSRTRRWILRLLEGADSPAAALVRAVAQETDPPPWLAATAAWLALPQSEDLVAGREPSGNARLPASDLVAGREPSGNARLPASVGAVLNGMAGHDPAVLQAARQQITEELAQELVIAMEAMVPGAACLAMPLRQGEHGPALARAQVTAWTHGLPGTLGEAAAAILVWNDDQIVVELLADPHARFLGLSLAAWVPTEAVLAALLELPLPADLLERRLFVQALAAMGDRAVVPHLTELASEHTHSAFDEPLALAEGLLGISLR